eukprot:TRINITY_DN912_c5_g1_i1.p1 TRINITY_DN912_c5_g1~~TRINITY_DN912_c5_g1_i1.p1  ORF type:complete len:873 (+),score=134.93 TRINITY_DN912_c5_g1_i1:90-2708(+)
MSTSLTVAQLADLMRRNNIPDSITEMFEEQGIDGSGFVDCLTEQDLLHDLNVTQYGTRKKILRIQHALQKSANAILPDTTPVESVLLLLRREGLGSEDPAGLDVSNAFIFHEIDGAAFKELTHDILKEMASAAQESADCGKQLLKWGVRAKILKQVRLFVGEKKDARSESSSIAELPMSALQQIATRNAVDYDSIISALQTHDHYNTHLDPATAVGSSPFPLKGSPPATDKVRLLLLTHKAGCVKWRDFMKGCSLEADLLNSFHKHVKGFIGTAAGDSATVTEVQKVISSHSSLLPASSSSESDPSMPSGNLSFGDIQATATSILVQDVVRIPSGGGTETPLIIYPPVYGIDALLGGDSVLRRDCWTSSNREVELRQGAHNITFAGATVILGGGGVDTRSPCVVSECLFYNCRIAVRAHGPSQDGLPKDLNGWVQTRNCVFINSEWMSRPFSHSLVTGSIFINTKIVGRNHADGTLRDNIIIVQGNDNIEDRISMQAQTRVRCERNLVRGSIATLGRLIRSQNNSRNNIFDVLPSKGVRVHWSELTDMVEIGRGGFGQVYKATFKGIPVAVKILKPIEGEATTPELLHRAIEKMVNEVEVSINLHLPNIVEIFGSGLSDIVNVFMVMEYCEYGSLYHLLKRGNSPEPLTALIMLYDIGVALSFIHASCDKIVHLDCRSSNIFVTSSGKLKLGDFGISVKQDEPVSVFPVLHSDPSLYLQETANGTIADISSGNSTGSSRCRVAKASCDMWSFGVLLWEIFAHGSTPYETLFSGIWNTPAFIYKVAAKICQGTKLQKPESCPSDVWEIAESCFSPPSVRPTSEQVTQQVKMRIDADTSGADHQQLVLDWISSLGEEDSGLKITGKAHYYDYRV